MSCCVLWLRIFLRTCLGFGLFSLLIFQSACHGEVIEISTEDTVCQVSDEPEQNFSSITFTAVGEVFPHSDLIDLEFLPGQQGELIVIAKDGTLYYLTADFHILSQTALVLVESEGEQGLLNIAADPHYATNHFIYLYYTLSDGSGNQVDRFTVTVDAEAETFSLGNQKTIITFSKSESSSPATNHNGGGLVFENEENLFISVGDGGGSASADTNEAIAQNTELGLGKIHRIIPNRTEGQGGYDLPSDDENISSSLLWPSIYSYGLRNPFSIVYFEGKLFIGDVGSSVYEEVDLALEGGINFAWPLEEGLTLESVYENPIGGYLTSDSTFYDEDPEHSEEDEDHEEHDDHGADPHSIIVSAFYPCTRYGDLLSNTLIYNEFYGGWVRGMKLDENHEVASDQHLGHLTGLTSLQKGVDDFLYGVSLFGSDQLLRLDGVE